MAQATTFSDVLDGVGRLTTEEQETLVDILQHRLAEQRRSQIAADVQAAQTELQQGQCRPVTVGELMAELQP